MVREIVIPKETQYLLRIPAEYLYHQIEILVLPFDGPQETTTLQQPRKLTTFRCGGVSREFSRRDAYREAS